MVIFVFLAAAAIFIIEGLPLIKGKQWKELITLVALLIIAVLLVIGDELGVAGPISMIKNMLTPIGKDLFTNTQTR